MNNNPPIQLQSSKLRHVQLSGHKQSSNPTVVSLTKDACSLTLKKVCHQSLNGSITTHLTYKIENA